MTNPYSVVIILMGIGVFLSALLIAIPLLTGLERKSPGKSSPYECGIPPSGDARQRIPVKFYLTAMFFIIFDIEVAFLYPWAVIFRKLGLAGFIEMLIFILILLAGFVYIWKKGALEWE
jgi:NADH-quinone oxidoreductase subunit A